MSDARTLADAVLRAERLAPSKVLYTFLEDGERASHTLTCADVASAARAIAAQLVGSCDRGSRILLAYRPGLAFVSAFYGCALAGMIAVPCYPPDGARKERTLPRLAGIVADAQPALLLTTRAVAETLPSLADAAPWLSALTVLVTDDLAPLAAWSAPLVLPDAPAVIQYTSGSTAAPRGVVLTHENLVANAAAIHGAFGVEETRGVSWLPVHHDMGLLGHVVVTMLHLVPNVFLSPLSFLARPLRWLSAISTHRATASGGPNFAYDLCVRRYSEVAARGLDLSSWSVAYNGAEPVSVATMARFTERFAPHGFRAEAFHPCYGLAEASLMVTSRSPLAGTILDGKAVGCGTAVPGTTVTIVDPETREARPEPTVGEIWVRGPGVARGYHGDAARSHATFGATLAGDDEGPPHLRTGDLGYLRDGELFVVGRAKDVVIVRGRNHHAHDLERTAQAAHPSVRDVAAFAWQVGEREGPALVVELASAEADSLESIVERVRAAITREHDVEVVELALVRRGTLPKTSSGKTQRAACRAQLEAGTLPTRWRSPPRV